MRKFLVVIMFTLAPFAAAFAQDVVGKWKLSDGTAIVEVYKDGDVFNGKIVWLKNPTEPNGGPAVDKNNPDAKLRSRQLIGLNMLSNLKAKDGEYSGAMTQLPGAKPAYSELIGDGSYENPFRCADGVVTGYDFYVGGFHLGLKGRQTSHSGAWVQCVHMYKYELKNKDAKVKVVVTDFFGNEYTETEITEGTDYTYTSGDYKN